MKNPAASMLTEVKSKNNNSKINAPHVIVIGGTSGLGLALALHHQQLGWQVSIVGHSATKINLINNQYPNIVTFTCDLTNSLQTQKLLHSLLGIYIEM